MEECLAQNEIDLLLFSSVLQYMDSPYQFLQRAMERNIEYIIIDRTIFFSDGDDRITVQKVPPHIYEASYPAWVINRNKFLGFMTEKYELIAEFDTLGGVVKLDDLEGKYLGMIFRLK